MKTLAIIQARASSSRLPGKVLMETCGKSLLELQVERVLRSQKIDKIILATSTNSDDDPIEDLCCKIGVECYRGSLNNVLERFYKAAEKYKPENVVRLTGDCPLSDPGLIDQVISYYFDNEHIYTTNAIDSTFPDGLDIEIFTFESLYDAWQHARLPSELEHVTPYIRKQLVNLEDSIFRGQYDFSSLRWTVDEKEDFELVSHIFTELYPWKPEFTWLDVLELVKRNSYLCEINTRFERNEGSKKSLLADLEFLNKD